MPCLFKDENNMSNAPKSYAEKTYQENFVNELKKYSWNAPNELNGNLQKVTVDTLINNWRRELNRLNADMLEGVDLTDKEFKQVLTKVSRISNSYEAATLLTAENGKGKIEGIYRDESPKVTRKTVTLTIFRRAQVLGGDSSYQIAREVSTPNGNRFDIVLLFCGLPLINIEQKRTDKSLDEAFGQFLRYYKDGEYCNNFMVFSQMMVINSEISTEYFATPKSADAFNRAFCFHWTDEKNRIINDWKEITATLLKIPMAHQMVGDYLVINHSDNPNECYHMLMRPYQVYALQAIELAAKGMDNKNKLAHGGYVWHTTGSGKTVTSFKTALFLATKGGFDKVVFLVDRRELDKNTTNRFKSYAEYEGKDKVYETKHTSELRRHLKRDNGIIITTTFKLNSLVKALEEAKDESLKEMKIIFIIDEAHRTTMGTMMKNIMAYFQKNGLFFGFTGTPLFDENKANGLIADDAAYQRKKRLFELTKEFLDEHEEVEDRMNSKGQLIIDTTEKLFGPLLHEYKIDEAIRDGNVLGFHVDYLNTGEFKNYDWIRDQLFEVLKEKTPEKSDKEIRRKIQEMSDEQVELEAMKKEIVVYQDETHIPRVVKIMLEDWEEQSQNRFFNAILTTGRISRAVEYWKEFRKQQESNPHPINVAVTFSFGNENDQENIAVKEADAIFESYKQITELEFKLNDAKRGPQQYFEDLIDRAQKGGSGRNPKNIDLVIVADQLLTGYDSKYLNTLYVDQNLKLQGLVQAYSRTNRIYGKEKEFGTVINFRWPKLTELCVNAALMLYGSGKKTDKSPAIVDTYEVAVDKLANCVEGMMMTLKNPADWEALKDDKEQKQAFFAAYKETSAQMNRVRQYYEYQWNNERFTLDEHTWKKYTGAFRNLIGEDDPPLPPPLPIRTLQDAKLIHYQEITSQFILKMIGERAHTNKQESPLDQESLRLILEQIEELSSMGQAVLAGTIRQFVDEIQTGSVQIDTDIEALFNTWTESKLKAEIAEFCEQWKTDPEILYKVFCAYDPRDDKNIPRVNEIIDSIKADDLEDPFTHNLNLMEALPDWLKGIKRKYSF